MSRRYPPGSDKPLGFYASLPWPAMSDTEAARFLNVGVELIRGLAGGKQIESVRVEGKTGRPKWFVRRSDIQELKKKMY